MLSSIEPRASGAELLVSAGTGAVASDGIDLSKAPNIYETGSLSGNGHTGKEAVRSASVTERCALERMRIYAWISAWISWSMCIPMISHQEDKNMAEYHVVIPDAGDYDRLYAPVCPFSCPLEDRSASDNFRKPGDSGSDLTGQGIIPVVEIAYDPQKPQHPDQDPARQERDFEDQQYKPLELDSVIRRTPTA